MHVLDEYGYGGNCREYFMLSLLSKIDWNCMAGLAMSCTSYKRRWLEGDERNVHQGPGRSNHNSEPFNQ
jgi:hypothetical protein